MPSSTRDDFSKSIKDLLAKRVGFKCSKLDCRRLTTGPHTDPGKSVNLGVAAHITAASPGGPRYNPHLTPAQRQAFENGIWLCQTDAKLIDSDEIKYSVRLIHQWKNGAEELAAKELENRLLRYPEFAPTFDRMERLMGDLLAEMRIDLAGYPLRREFVVKNRSTGYWAKGNELFYYYEDHDDLDDKLNILENVGLINNFSSNKTKRYRLTEQLAEYLGAP